MDLETLWRYLHDTGDLCTVLFAQKQIACSMFTAVNRSSPLSLQASRFVDDLHLEAAQDAFENIFAPNSTMDASMSSNPQPSSQSMVEPTSQGKRRSSNEITCPVWVSHWKF